MSNAQNALVQRSMLKQHRAWAAKYDINPADIRPQTLLLFARLAADKETYYFDVDDKATSICPIENRLKDSSLFFANLFALGLLKAPVASSVEYPAGAPMVHYPDKTIFATAAGTAVLSEAQALEMVFHSSLTLKTDQTVRLDEMACEIFRFAPDTQSGAAAHPSQGLALIDISTSFFIWGDRKNQFTLQLPQGGDRTHVKGGAAAQNFLVIGVGGFEVVNAGNNARTKDFSRFVEENMGR
jgi:hypothetical protein